MLTFTGQQQVTVNEFSPTPVFLAPQVDDFGSSVPLYIKFASPGELVRFNYLKPLGVPSITFDGVHIKHNGTDVGIFVDSTVNDYIAFNELLTENALSDILKSIYYMALPEYYDRSYFSYIANPNISLGVEVFYSEGGRTYSRAVSDHSASYPAAAK